nr:hypothetical protein [Micromonospora sp. HM134]
MNATLPLTVGLAVLIGVSLGLLGGGGSILAVPLLVYVADLPTPCRCRSPSAPRWW